MANQPFRKQGGGTEAEFRQQSNVEVSLKGLSNIAILDGALLKNVQVSTSETLVPHKLGRPYQGYIICSNNAYTAVKLNSSTTSDAKLFISLSSSAPCTLTLWVF